MSVLNDENRLRHMRSAREELRKSLKMEHNTVVSQAIFNLSGEIYELECSIEECGIKELEKLLPGIRKQATAKRNDAADKAAENIDPNCIGSIYRGDGTRIDIMSGDKPESIGDNATPPPAKTNSESMVFNNVVTTDRKDRNDNILSHSINHNVSSNAWEFWKSYVDSNNSKDKLNNELHGGMLVPEGVAATMEEASKNGVFALFGPVFVIDYEDTGKSRLRRVERACQSYECRVSDDWMYITDTEASIH